MYRIASRNRLLLLCIHQDSDSLWWCRRSIWYYISLRNPSLERLQLLDRQKRSGLQERKRDRRRGRNGKPSKSERYIDPSGDSWAGGAMDNLDQDSLYILRRKFRQERNSRLQLELGWFFVLTRLDFMLDCLLALQQELASEAKDTHPKTRDQARWRVAKAARSTSSRPPSPPWTPWTPSTGTDCLLSTGLIIIIIMLLTRSTQVCHALRTAGKSRDYCHLLLDIVLKTLWKLIMQSLDKERDEMLEKERIAQHARISEITERWLQTHRSLWIL